MRPSLKYWLVGSLIALLAGADLFNLFGAKQSPILHPKAISGVVFINETSDHYYDKSLKLSVKVAEQRAGIQNAVILLDHFPGNRSAEELAVEYFQKYRIGQRTHGKGILLLYSEKEKQLKIEVSYALEPIITDAICRRLEDGARTFMLTGSRRDFLTELLVTLNLYYFRKTRGENPGELEFPYEPGSFALSRHLSGGAGVVGRGYSKSIEQRRLEVQELAADQRQRYAPDADPEVVVRRYLDSIEQGVGAVDLPLLTEGSKIYRMEFPRSRGYLRRNHEFYEQAKPYRIYTQDDKAAALFRPGYLVWPVLLRKDDKGLWLVDEARAWAYIHIAESGFDPIQKSLKFPYAFAWKQRANPKEPAPIYPDGRVFTPALPDYPDDLTGRIHAAEKKIENEPNNAKHYFDLANILYFDCYWLTAAIPLFEKGLALEPDRMEYHWRLIDLYINDTHIDKMLKELADIAKRDPGDRLAADWLDYFRKAFNN